MPSVPLGKGEMMIRMILDALIPVTKTLTARQRIYADQPAFRKPTQTLSDQVPILT